MTNGQPTNDRAAWIQGPPAKCSVAPESRNRPWRLVLLGAPGVGKGTQAELLCARLGTCHLSTGDVFRAAAGKRGCTPTPAMAAALQFMRRGELVPDSTVWDIVRERVGCMHCHGGFVLDGFPRTLGQAYTLQMLLKTEGIWLDGVLNYELPTEEIVARLSGRRVCEKCKAVFHVTQRPPRELGVCDNCGSTLIQREDDRPESISVRLQAYHRDTAPLIEFYGELGLLVPITATGSPDEVFAHSLSALETAITDGRLRGRFPQEAIAGLTGPSEAAVKYKEPL
jgi:adenylate kinase